MPELRSCGKDAPTTADGVFILGDLLPGEIYITVDQQTLPALFIMNPQRLKVFIQPGRRVDGLRIAIQPRERNIEEKVLPSQMLSSSAATAASAPTAPGSDRSPAQGQVEAVTLERKVSPGCRVRPGPDEEPAGFLTSC